MSPPRHLKQLEARLASLAGDDPMLLSELDGLLAGILVCPELIMPNERLPIALGQDGEDEPVCENENAMQETVRLVLKHYNVLSRTLQHDSGRYQPIFDVGPRRDEVLWELWMAGFERAMSLRPDSWLTIAQDPDDEEAALAMAGMLALVAIANREGDTDPDTAKVDELTEAAPDLIPERVETLNRGQMLNSTNQPSRWSRPRSAGTSQAPAAQARNTRSAAARIEMHLVRPTSRAVEPPRVCRRQFCLSHAAMACSVVCA